MSALTFNNLIVGKDIPFKFKAYTITGGNYTAGTALGQITASKKLTKLNSAAVDGSNKIFGILMEDCDASSADKVASVGLTGEYNQSKIVFGGTDTIATHEKDARALQIYFETTVRNY